MHINLFCIWLLRVRPNTVCSIDTYLPFPPDLHMFFRATWRCSCCFFTSVVLPVSSGLHFSSMEPFQTPHVNRYYDIMTLNLSSHTVKPSSHISRLGNRFGHNRTVAVRRLFEYRVHLYNILRAIYTGNFGSHTSTYLVSRIKSAPVTLDSCKFLIHVVRAPVVYQMQGFSTFDCVVFSSNRSLRNTASAWCSTQQWKQMYHNLYFQEIPMLHKATYLVFRADVNSMVQNMIV